MKYGVSTFLTGEFLGLSRLEVLNDRHDGWNILAGAVVGIGSSYFIYYTLHG